MIDIDALTDDVIADLRRMKTEGITPPDMRVYEKQRLFIQNDDHFSAFVAGIGSGKTYAGAYKALRHARPGTLGLITAPSYGVLRDATIRTFREVAGDYIEKMNRHPPIECTLKNGAEILFRSAHDFELLRGPSVSWYWGDEAALYAPGVWDIAMGRLREHGKLGHAWLTTTPKGRNWIYDTFIRPGERDDYWIIKAATHENPYIDPAYYNSLKAAYQGAFARQELEGDFVTYDGLVYEEFDRDVHIQPTIPNKQYARVIAGVDWGYSNPGVIVVYGIDGDGRMHGLHEEYVRRRQIEEWATVARQLQAQYRIETLYCDPAEPGFIDRFRMEGLNVEAAQNAIIEGIQKVKSYLALEDDGRGNKRPRITFDPSFVNTAAEFEQYQWAKNIQGVKDKPMDASNHSLDATRYACMGASVPPLFFDVW